MEINRKKLLIRLTLLILFIFLVNFLAMKFYWYFSIWWFDMPMHILGGFWVGLCVMWLFPPRKVSLNSVLKIILTVFFIGILWEIFEVIVNEYIAQNPFNFFDTVSDLIFDLTGGFLSILYFFKRIIFNSQTKL